jgi:hypothetical protein
MSFDLPADVERELVRYAKAEHISPIEAAVKFIQSGLEASKSRVKNTDELSQSELDQLNGFGKTFGLLADVPDDTIDRIASTIERMKKEGFPNRA